MTINKNDLYKKVLVCFFPLLLQQLITNLLSIIDNFMLGRFNDSLIYCVSISGKIVNVISLFLLGLSCACSIFIAQYNGRNEISKMKEAFRFSIVISFIVVIPIIFLGFANSERIFSLFSSDASIIKLGSSYLRIVFLSFIPSIVSLNIFNSMRSVGILMPPLISNLCVIISKVILNIIFMYYPYNWGIYGAGIAYMGSRIIELIIMLILLKYQNCPFKTDIKDLFKFKFKMAKAIAYKMLPLGLNELLWGIATALIYMAYTAYSTNIFAGYSIAMTYFEIFRILIGTLGMVITIIITPYLSRNEFHEAKIIGKELLKIGFYISIVFGIGLYLSKFTIPLIYHSSTLALDTANHLINIICILFPLSIIQGLFYFLFRTGGDNLSIYITDSLHLFFITVPLAFLLVNVFHANIFVTYIIIELSYFIKCINCINLLKKEKWLKNLTTTEEKI